MTIQEWKKIPQWERDYTHYNKAWASFSLYKLGHKIIILHHLNPGCNDYKNGILLFQCSNGVIKKCTENGGLENLLVKK
jgi:hypothetical protein